MAGVLNNIRKFQDRLDTKCDASEVSKALKMLREIKMKGGVLNNTTETFNSEDDGDYFYRLNHQALPEKVESRKRVIKSSCSEEGSKSKKKSKKLRSVTDNGKENKINFERYCRSGMPEETENSREYKKRKAVEYSKSEEPRKELRESSFVAVDAEKRTVQDSGFLFQNVPEVFPTKTKNKRKTAINGHPVTKSSPHTKINLHFSEMNSTHRSLPQPRVGTISSEKGERTLTDSQAAELHTKRQTKKTLVHSGHSGAMVAEEISLYDQCMDVLMNNIDAIYSFDGVPYQLVLPILKKCTSKQLYRLEHHNSYLLEDTGEIWKQHCLRDFRGKTPAETESWRDMFTRLSDERDAKLKRITARISQKEAKKKLLEKKAKFAYVESSAKPPRNVVRAQEKYGTAARIKSTPSVPHSSAAAAVKKDLIASRMSILQNSIAATVVDQERKKPFVRDSKKPRTAPMMAKSLRSVRKMGYKR